MAPEAPQADESRPYSTQIFTMPAPSDPGATVANAAPTQDETVDSLMAQISSQASPRPNMNVPDPASAPSHALCVSAGFGPRSVAAFDAAGQCRLANVAVRPSRPFGSG